MSMILSTHALGGAAAALLSSGDPVTALGAGVLSHVLLDMVPHWHYRLRSRERRGDRMSERLVIQSRAFALDLAVMGAECIFGFMLALGSGMYNGHDLSLLWWGAVGGVLPDFLQFVYHLYPRTPVREIQRFHKWVHARRDLDDAPLLGIGTQAAFVLAFVWIILW